MKRKLGSFERALLTADRQAPFNIVSAVELENPPPPSIVEQALRLLQEHHPFLRARVLEEDGVAYFVALNPAGLPFQTIQREADGQWTGLVEKELETRLDASNGPLFRCSYLYSGHDPRAEIVFTFLHPIVDAASAAQLIHDLLGTSDSLMQGRQATFEKLAAAPPLEAAFPPSYRGIRLRLHLLGYAIRQMADELSYRIRARGTRQPPVHAQPGHGRVLPALLSEESTAALSRRARRAGVTLNSALNAAMMLAVNRHLYEGRHVPMRTFTFANLRPYVEPPLGARNLACYISMLRYTVQVGGETDFWSLARAVHARMYSSFKSGDKFAASVMAEPLMNMVTRLRAFRMGSTALNYSGAVPLQRQYGAIRVTGIHGFISAFDLGPEFSGEAQILNDRLFLDFMYLDADMSKDMARTIVDEFLAILKAAASPA